MRNSIYINGIEGVSVGGNAVANVPVGRRYHQFDLFVGDSGAPDVSKVLNVRVYVNGVLIRDMTPALAIGVAKVRNALYTPVAGHIPIYWSQPERATVEGEELSALDLSGQQKCTIEIQFSGTATAPTLKISADWDLEQQIFVKNGKTYTGLNIIKMLPITYNAPAGVYDLTTIPVTYPIQAIHLVPSTGTVSFCEVYDGQNKLLEATAAENASRVGPFYQNTAALGYSILFDRERQITSGLQATNLLVRPTLSAPCSLTAFVEMRAPGYM